MTGLPISDALAIAGNTSSGAQQLTPTATISSTPRPPRRPRSAVARRGSGPRRSCSSATPASRPSAPRRPTLPPRRRRERSRRRGRRPRRPPGSPAGADASAPRPRPTGRSVRGIPSRRPAPRRTVRPRPRRAGPEFARAGLVPRGLREVDAAAQQPVGFPTIQSARRETLERRLVAGRRRDRGPGAKVGGVDGDDLAWGVREQPGRPQPIGQVMAARFQLGGQAAIEQHGSAGPPQAHGQTHVATVG